MTMRQYKFRGIRKDNGEWAYGYLHLNALGATCIQIIKERTLEMAEVLPESVGQFTGLKDKNGTEIWEGDVLGQDCAMIDDYTGKESIEVQKLIVRWSDKDLRWTVYDPDAMIKDDWGYVPRKAYVIGSIHTTPIEKSRI